jgi:hypothetical protein
MDKELEALEQVVNSLKKQREDMEREQLRAILADLLSLTDDVHGLLGSMVVAQRDGHTLPEEILDEASTMLINWQKVIVPIRELLDALE